MINKEQNLASNNADDNQKVVPEDTKNMVYEKVIEMIDKGVAWNVICEEMQMSIHEIDEIILKIR